ANAPTRGATTIRLASYCWYRRGLCTARHGGDVAQRAMLTVRALTGASRQRLRSAHYELSARVHRVAPGGLSGWPAAALAASAPLSVALATTGRFPSQPYRYDLYHAAH